jgi:hypothetical protein
VVVVVLFLVVLVVALLGILHQAYFNVVNRAELALTQLQLLVLLIQQV